METQAEIGYSCFYRENNASARVHASRARGFFQSGGASMTIVQTPDTYVDVTAFQDDVAYLEGLFRRRVVGDNELPLIDTGQGAPLVFVPILEHLEFVYARQVRF